MAEGKEKALMGKSPSKAQLNSIARAFAKAASPGGRISDKDLTRALNVLRGMGSKTNQHELKHSQSLRQKKKSGGKVKKAKGMAKGGKMKSKGYAKGGKTMMKKSKGMARGGKMMRKSKGMARGGRAKR
jgi:hypothetical protein